MNNYLYINLSTCRDRYTEFVEYDGCMMLIIARNCYLWHDNYGLHDKRTYFVSPSIML